LRLPSDEADDGRIYARLALNVLEHRSYSLNTEEPYSPTLIRVPGYPLFIAGCYAAFGGGNNQAVRVVQAVLDTVTCWLIALLAVTWSPSDWPLEKRRALLLIALALAVSFPFLAIYVATILTETCATLFITGCALAASLAMRRGGNRREIAWWAISGLCAGLATMLRPDSVIFITAVGLALLAPAVYPLIKHRTPRTNGSYSSYRSYEPRPIRTVVSVLALFIGFVVVLTPWTVRNERVVGIFQPIAPRYANMPGEFVPKGYMDWLRTWVDDVKYTESMEFPLDVGPLHIEKVPEYAFDSAAEREQVAALIARYNGTPITNNVELQNSSVQNDAAGETPKTGIEQSAPTDGNADDQDTEKDSESSSDDDEDSEEPSSEEPAQFGGEMTPEIDAGFEEIARERISRHPVRYYLVVPLKRASSLWFDTHSQYYPFQGELFPLSDLNTDLRQQYWLPMFALLTVLYTLLGLAGIWLMWTYRTSRRWLLLVTVLIIPRLAFLATLENPEPRYVVEFFGFVLAAGSISLTEFIYRLRRLRRA
jgi:dolichyl-phosphate-mannose-protein mannosyltransferase